MRIALVSRELYPLGGGGIGQFVASAANLLSRVAEVTVLTSELGQAEYDRLHAAGDPRLPSESVRVAFVPEPDAATATAALHRMQVYSANAYARLKELYPDGGPELIEFPDYLGEGFIALQAADALDPWLRATQILVRIHTTVELVEVLNGHVETDAGRRVLHAMERYSLARADRLIWEGGDVLGAYGRFYGPAALAPPALIRYPYAGSAAESGADLSYAPGEKIRMLYAGRLERRKGVHHLVRALTGLGRDDFRVTIVGGDTPTGPLGVSMRELIGLELAGDGRFELREAIDRSALAELIRAHDVVLIPSLWECWPYAALEALALNRPVIATPVGGLTEMVIPGRSGWLTGATGPEALESTLEAVLDDREALLGLTRAEGPRTRAEELSAPDEILGAYEGLVPGWAGRHARVRRPRSEQLPLVSAIVPYWHSARYVQETLESLGEQSYPRLEIVLVNDGSFADEDWIVAELAARMPVVVVSQMNRGLGAARNFGILNAQGRYVFPLDADNTVDPDFVSRCVEVLEARPEVAYVTAWSRYVDEHSRPIGDGEQGYEPLGNFAALNEVQNVAGDAAAVLRRRLFDIGFQYSEELTSYEDWHLYRELARAGRYGCVIPERLLRYRVHSESMQARIAVPRQARLRNEIAALMRESEVRWTSSSA